MLNKVIGCVVLIYFNSLVFKFSTKDSISILPCENNPFFLYDFLVVNCLLLCGSLSFVPSLFIYFLLFKLILVVSCF